jgi:hypothetical protein
MEREKLFNGDFVLFRVQSRYLISRAVLTAIMLSMEIKVKFNIYSFFVCVCVYVIICLEIKIKWFIGVKEKFGKVLC